VLLDAAGTTLGRGANCEVILDHRTVSSLQAKDRGEFVEIDVCDTGIGIPADEVENVFEEFFRAANARKSEYSGTGLGLSIVKQIIDRHGGEITVQSQQGGGTRFTVKLPKGNPAS